MIARAYTAFLLAALVIVAPSAVAGSAAIEPGGARVAVPVRSLQELRFINLVPQSWDTSCGAAALSTLFTYHLNRPVTEYAVATWILRGVDPQRVRARGGFSLFDLKRFSEALGYRAEGYGSLTLQDLDALATAAIVPVRIHGLDHFVVLRDIVGGHVVIGDPAFGNLTLPVERFERLWKGGIAFVVHAAAGAAADDALGATQISNLRVPDLPAVTRLLRGGGPVPVMRGQPTLP
jgi:predicted double-glycine peptidase